jgi:hypothetical protein
MDSSDGRALASYPGVQKPDKAWDFLFSTLGLKNSAPSRIYREKLRELWVVSYPGVRDRTLWPYSNNSGVSPSLSPSVALSLYHLVPQGTNAPNPHPHPPYNLVTLHTIEAKLKSNLTPLHQIAKGHLKY